MDKQFLYTLVPACSSQMQHNIFHAKLHKPILVLTEDGASLGIQIPQIQDVNAGWLVLSPS